MSTELKNEKIYNLTISKARGKELAAEIVNVIKAHPEQHFQASWGEGNECGTTACIAGWAAFLTGKAHYEVDSQGGMSLLTENGFMDFDEISAKLLELNQETADKLFFYYNNEGALKALEHIAAGEEVPWSEIMDAYPEPEED